MKHAGNVNLLGNGLFNFAIPPSDTWPAEAKLGGCVNYKNRLYLCINLHGAGDLPVYIPLTSTISSYVHRQTLAASTWVIPHGLNFDVPMIQVYDATGEKIEPNIIDVVDANNVTLEFNVELTGSAVVLCLTDALFNVANSGGGGSSTIAGHTIVGPEGAVLPRKNLLFTGATVTDQEGNDATVIAFHEHANAGVLDAITEVDGNLMYGNSVIQYAFDNATLLSKFAQSAEGALVYDGVALQPALTNIEVLSKFTVVNAKLMFNNKEVEFVTGPDDIVAKFTVQNGKLFFDGQPVDTVGSVFANETDLRKLSVVSGELQYDGKPVFRTPYEQIGINVVGTVDTAATVNAVSSFTSKLPKDFSGSVGICVVPPASALALPIKVDGVQIGTINIATSGAVSFTGTSATDLDIVSGARISVVLDSMIGSGAGDLSVTLRLGV